jgi:hypothetical protein
MSEDGNLQNKIPKCERTVARYRYRYRYRNRYRYMYRYR